MISADEIQSYFDEDYEGERWQQASRWRVEQGAAEWELVDEDVCYELTEEKRNLRVTGVGTFEHVESGGIYHDGGPVFNVIKFVDLEGNEELFIQEGQYSSWDSTYYGEWEPAEQYTFTETRWRATK